MSLPMFKAAWNSTRTSIIGYLQFFTSDNNAFLTSDSKTFEVRQ